MCFTAIKIEIKKKKKKVEKLGFFERVSPMHSFGQRFENFPIFYFSQNQTGECI